MCTSNMAFGLIALHSFYFKSAVLLEVYTLKTSLSANIDFRTDFSAGSWRQYDLQHVHKTKFNFKLLLVVH